MSPASPPRKKFRRLLPQPDNTVLAEFFSAATAAFHRASANRPKSQSIEIAGLRIELQFASEALLPHVVRALAHNRVASSSAPSLRVRLWDAKSTNVPFPPAPWRHDGTVKRGQIEGLNSERFHISIEAGFGGISLLDMETNEAVFYAPAPDVVPFYDSAAPLRSLLARWLTLRGLQLVHGGAVGVNGRGILLGGRSGSGKSTTSLLCLEDGMDYVSDDYSVLSLSPSPRVHSLYNSAKIRPEDLERFPKLFGEAQHNIGDEKRHVFIFEQHPEQVVRSLELMAVVLPRVVGSGATQLVRVGGAAALMALAPSSIFQLPGAGAPAFDYLSQLVRAAPCYRLELGGSTRDVAPAIRAFLQ